jgi:hypothetical protein
VAGRPYTQPVPTIELRTPTDLRLTVALRIDVNLAGPFRTSLAVRAGTLHWDQIPLLMAASVLSETGAKIRSGPDVQYSENEL